MLVWPGHAITTPLPNALAKPAASASRKPFPYASSITTDTMPHEIPSIAKPARNRLRDRPAKRLATYLDEDLWPTEPASRVNDGARTCQDRLDGG